MKLLEWLFGWNEWLWNLLPDNCERENCERWGCRGNENIIDGMVVCDYCHCADVRRAELTKEMRHEDYDLIPWTDKHWWTDTGHCAPGCPGCEEEANELQ